MNILYSV